MASIILLASLFSSAKEDNKDFNKMANKMASKFNTPIVTSAYLSSLPSSKDAIILDAREIGEFNVSSIKGAKHVGYEKFDIEKTIKNLDKNKKIIVYCSVGYRSGEIAKKLKAKGYNAHNLHGGLFGWVNEGRAVSNANGETTKVHGYNREWSKWLKKGEIVYNE